jgi:hypothetical protein
MSAAAGANRRVGWKQPFADGRANGEVAPIADLAAARSFELHPSRTFRLRAHESETRRPEFLGRARCDSGMPALPL